jgi:hypothetical protein
LGPSALRRAPKVIEVLSGLSFAASGCGVVLEGTAQREAQV